jgi:hypothetical protein
MNSGFSFWDLTLKIPGFTCLVNDASLGDSLAAFSGYLMFSFAL